jgi:hypothetical protein
MLAVGFTCLLRPRAFNTFRLEAVAESGLEELSAAVALVTLRVLW